MTEEEEATQLLHGRVKWFDPSKGFGFIVSDESEVDVLLHANVLRNFGQSSIADGAGIAVRVQKTQRGVQAVEVVRIDPPEGAAFPLTEQAVEMLTRAVAATPLPESLRGRSFSVPMPIRFSLVGIVIYQDSLNGVEDGVRRVGRERRLGLAFHPV